MILYSEKGKQLRTPWILKISRLQCTPMSRRAEKFPFVSLFRLLKRRFTTVSNCVKLLSQWNASSR